MFKSASSTADGVEFNALSRGATLRKLPWMLPVSLVLDQDDKSRIASNFIPQSGHVEQTVACI
ncbi:hypothetical protein [Thiomonas sp. X19]|uniref:hypothetical protein n=1 Tax=Thiomonas sp. X19 TaxID=1050370 RepID=UPI000DDBCF7C|nr:hypothetical protein [Thiomonas sp. X19]